MYIFLLFFICVYVCLDRRLALSGLWEKCDLKGYHKSMYVAMILCKQMRFYVDHSSVLFMVNLVNYSPSEFDRDPLHN